MNWNATMIQGGAYSKDNAPRGIIDLVDLLEQPQFSVQPFCITTEPAPADIVDIFFNNLAPQQRQDLFPESQQRGTISNGLDPIRASARVSQRMAIAFAKRTGERSGRQVALPTLEEYVAAAWDLQTRRFGTPEADAYLVTLRTGNLQWTSTACGSLGSYWTIGPGAQGRLVKLCYEQSRVDRTSFRLSIK
jgi:hypothetical protein